MLDMGLGRRFLPGRSPLRNQQLLHGLPLLAMDEGLGTTKGPEKSKATKTDKKVKAKIFLLTFKFNSGEVKPNAKEAVCDRQGRKRSESTWQIKDGVRSSLSCHLAPLLAWFCHAGSRSRASPQGTEP